MKTKIINNTKFPVRKVTSVRDAKADSMSAEMGIAKYVTLECGHDVGVKVGFDVPNEVPCYFCDKEGRP